MSQLLPDTFLENTKHLYLPEVQARSKLLYGVVLLAVVVAAGATFFIQVDVSFSASGALRSVAEKTEIRTLVSGRVLQTFARENQLIQVGDTLLRVAPDAISEKLRYNRFQQTQQAQITKDLQFLTHPNKDISEAIGRQPFQTSLYAQQYNQLQAQLHENEVRRKKAEKELKADKYLHGEKVVSTRELDAKQAEVDQLYEEYRLLIERQVSQWEADLNTQRLSLAQLRTEETQLLKEQELYMLRAPVAGTLQQWVGKYEGSFVQAGEVLGILSPDSSLIVECYVAPSNMGLLRLKQTVLFQLDALNYREWGLARGTVLEIAKDFNLVKEQPFFKVKCRLETPHLQLKNGYKVRLQKGMTLQARFVVIRRTLAQLLFDKVDDWFNPHAKEN